MNSYDHSTVGCGKQKASRGKASKMKLNYLSKAVDQNVEANAPKCKEQQNHK